MVILQLNFTRFFKAFQFNKNGRKGRKKECRVRKKASSGMESQRVPYLLEIKKSLILLIICLLFHVVRKKMVITAKQTVHFFFANRCICHFLFKYENTVLAPQLLKLFI